MQTRYLSEEERGQGQSRVYRFQALNGLGFNFMGETPVYLLAIHFGATNVQLGYISSVIFLTGLILVVLPRMLVGKNLVKVQSSAWFIRGLFVLLYFFLFFLEGKMAVWLILIVYTLFCMARMAGVVIWDPLMKMVTTSQNRGEVLSQANIANQGASVIAKLISFIITSFQMFTGVIGILLLQVFGVLFNSAAAYQIRQIPCRENVEYRRGRNLLVLFRESIKMKERLYPLILRWVSISLIVINGLTVVFVRKEAGFTANYVFLFTLAIALANIFSGIFSKTFADRIGSRPLLIGINIFLTITYLLWMLLPLAEGRPIPSFLYYLLGFFSNFFLLSTHMLIGRVVVNSMPENEVIPYNSMINFVTALFSLAAGILGGILIDKGEVFQSYLPNSFSLLFLLAMILSFFLILFSQKLIEQGSLSPKETAGILFSLEGLRAYNFIGKLNHTEDPEKKRTVIMSISRNEAPIATEEMRSIIASPLSTEKSDVIESLFNRPRPELQDALIREALDSGSYYQTKAIFSLGAYENPEVEKNLLKLLDSPDSSVRSNSAKSLGRIGNKTALDRISRLAEEAGSPWDRINYLIALHNMDQEGAIYRNTYRIPDKFKKGIFRQTYYSLSSDLLGLKPKLAEIYVSKNLRKGNGLKNFLEQTRDQHSFFQAHRDLIHWFRLEDWSSIGEFCLKAMEENGEKLINLSGPLQHLSVAIKEEANRMLDMENQKTSLIYDNALSLVFFTYHILTES